MEYKSVEKYLKNKNGEKKNKKKNYIYSFFIKFFICIIVILLGLIFVKGNSNLKSDIKSFLGSHNINVSRINSFYKKHFGDILPFQSIAKDKTNLVFNESLSYNKLEKYKSGVKLYTDESYLIPNQKDGIVIFVGNKDDYGKTIIIEQTDGVDVWYGNISNINVSTYDYVNKGEIIGEAKNSFYVVFEKDGKYLDYKKYIK